MTLAVQAFLPVSNEPGQGLHAASIDMKQAQ